MEEIHNSQAELASGLTDSLSGSVDTFIMHCAVKEEKDQQKEILVDGYDLETSTTYQFYGCKWHGCPCIAGSQIRCLESTNDYVEHPVKQMYQKTLNLENEIHSLGYNVKHFQKKFIHYLHYIVYDFEAVLSRWNLGLTFDLKIYCSHIPISIAINDSLTNKTIFLENRDQRVCSRA